MPEDFVTTYRGVFVPLDLIALTAGEHIVHDARLQGFKRGVDAAIATVSGEAEAQCVSTMRVIRMPSIGVRGGEWHEQEDDVFMYRFGDGAWGNDVRHSAQHLLCSGKRTVVPGAVAAKRPQ